MDSEKIKSNKETIEEFLALWKLAAEEVNTKQIRHYIAHADGKETFLVCDYSNPGSVDLSEGELYLIVGEEKKKVSDKLLAGLCDHIFASHLNREKKKEGYARKH